MTLFEENFFKLFINKHGMKAFEEIKSNIIEEAGKELNSDYISTIFNIAYAKYIGISENRIEDFIKDILGQDGILNYDIKRILDKHEQSINKIVKYIASTENEF